MLYNQQTKICEEQRKIIGIKPVIDMKHFVILLLADLASKSPIIYLDGRDTKTACLAFDYKRIIEEIMYQENGWGIKFAELINIYSYYEYQMDYEEKLTKMIKKVCSQLNKECYFDFEDETIRIDFTKEEIDNIKNMYDEHTLKTMDHFSNLLSDSSFRREFKMHMKDIDRDIARWHSHIEDLKLRAKYSNRLKIAKPLYDKETENNKDKSVIKKIGKLLKK